MDFLPSALLVHTTVLVFPFLSSDASPTIAFIASWLVLVLEVETKADVRTSVHRTSLHHTSRSVLFWYPVASPASERMHAMLVTFLTDPPRPAPSVRLSECSKNYTLYVFMS